MTRCATASHSIPDRAFQDRKTPVTIEIVGPSALAIIGDYAFDSEGSGRDSSSFTLRGSFPKLVAIGERAFSRFDGTVSLDIDAPNLVFLGEFAFREAHMGSSTNLFMVFLMRPVSTTIRKQDSEIAECRWLPLAEYWENAERRMPPGSLYHTMMALACDAHDRARALPVEDTARTRPRPR